MNSVYEGCFAEETRLRVNGVDVSFNEMVDVNAVKALGTGFHDMVVDVDTLGATVKAKVYYDGEKPVTRIVAGDHEFEGSNHPIMVVQDDGNLAWRTIESIRPGDMIVVAD